MFQEPLRRFSLMILVFEWTNSQFNCQQPLVLPRVIPPPAIMLVIEIDEPLLQITLLCYELYHTNCTHIPPNYGYKQMPTKNTVQIELYFQILSIHEQDIYLFKFMRLTLDLHDLTSLNMHHTKLPFCRESNENSLVACIHLQDLLTIRMFHSLFCSFCRYRTTHLGYMQCKHKI